MSRNTPGDGQYYRLPVGVPYSEHSNYEELVRFVKFIKADKVIPTVPMSNREMYGHLKSIVDSYTNKPRQQNIQQFFAK